MIGRAMVAAAALLPLVAARDEPLAGRVAGAPVDCIDLSTVTGPEIVDTRTILYRRGGRTWRTGPIGTCPSLRPFQIVIADVYGAQLCRNDRFRLLTPSTSIPSGYCRFDRFTPFDRSPKRKPEQLR